MSVDLATWLAEQAAADAYRLGQEGDPRIAAGVRRNVQVLALASMAVSLARIEQALNRNGGRW